MIIPSFSPTATERVLPRLALDFTTGTLDPRVTVARALNTATRVNSSGFIETVNANLPRFDYNPATLASNGILIEEQRTNLLPYSSDFRNTAAAGSTRPWSWTNTTITADAAIAPDGTTTADKMVAAVSGSSGHTIQQSVAFAFNTAYTLSVFAKKGEFDYLALNIYSGTTSYWTWFNLANGTIGTASSNPGRTITDFGNGWYRCTITVTTAASGSPNFAIFVTPTNGVLTFVGDGTSGIYVWGAQLEAGAFATSYIPTTTTSLTRNADVVSMTGTNFSSWYNASQGTFYVQGIPTTTASSGALSIDDGTSSQRMQVRALSNGAQAAVVDGGATQANITTGTWAANAKGQCVFAYKVDNFACAAGGAAAGTDAAGTVPTVNNLKIGGSAGLNQAYFNGAISKVFYWPQRCINAEVQAFSKG